MEMLEKKLRKRIQKRKNQQARRLRLQAQQTQHRHNSECSYTTHRWRVNLKASSAQVLDAGHPATLITARRQGSEWPASKNCNEVIHSSKASYLAPINRVDSASLSSDHLIHLIHHNALRGYVHNKGMLRLSAVYYRASPSITSSIPIIESSICAGFTTIHLVDQSIPADLAPTHLQIRLPHSPWINMLPFPDLRDNLILRQGLFDHNEFLADILGSEVDIRGHAGQGQTSNWRNNKCLGQGAEDGVTTSPCCIILWGEPHLQENWEVTPAFFRKWSWALNGCDELIRHSNRWRATRGESPL